MCTSHNWWGVGSRWLRRCPQWEEMRGCPVLDKAGSTMNPPQDTAGPHQPHAWCLWTRGLHRASVKTCLTEGSKQQKPRHNEWNNKARVGGVRSQKKKGAGWSRRREQGLEQRAASQAGLRRAATAAGTCMSWPHLSLLAASPKGLRAGSWPREGRPGRGEARNVLPKLVGVCFNTRMGN